MIITAREPTTLVVGGIAAISFYLKLLFYTNIQFFKKSLIILVLFENMNYLYM